MFVLSSHDKFNGFFPHFSGFKHNLPAAPAGRNGLAGWNPIVVCSNSNGNKRNIWESSTSIEKGNPFGAKPRGIGTMPVRV